MRIAAALAVLIWTAPAYAGDGGKLPWHNNKDRKSEAGVKEAIAAAKRAGKPMLIYFTSDG